MSERLSTSETASSTAATSSAARSPPISPRRSVPARCACAPLISNDGNFEEVPPRQRAPARPLFFHPARPLLKGMRIRVTFLHPKRSCPFEQDGEVVRVTVGRTVMAWPWPSSAQLFEFCASETLLAFLQCDLYFARQAVSVQSSPRRIAGNRAPLRVRSPFVAPIELIDMRAGSCIRPRFGPKPPRISWTH